jgi:hypothetical protein
VAVWAGAFHIAVGKKTDAFGAKRQLHPVFVDITFFQQLEEKILCHVRMVLSTSCGKQVEGYPQFLPGIEETLMIASNYILRCFALRLSAESNRCAVLVRARDHQYLVTLETMITSKYIGRQICAGDVSQMQWPIGIGPGYPNKNTFSHEISIFVYCNIGWGKTKG